MASPGTIIIAPGGAGGAADVKLLLMLLVVVVVLRCVVEWMLRVLARRWSRSALLGLHFRHRPFSTCCIGVSIVLVC